MRLASVLLAGLGLSVSAGTSLAVTVVDFSADNITPGTIGQPWDPQVMRAADTTGSNLVWNFSTTSAMTPANTGNSALIYGGLAFTNGAPTQTATLSVSKSSDYYGACQLLQYNDQVSGGSHYNTDVAWASVWTKPGFLNGASSGAVSFDSGSSMSFNITGWTTGWWTDNELRFIVQNGANWYVSGDLSAGNPSTGTYSLSNPAAATWYAYSPSGSTFGLSQVGAAATPAFDDVQAVGFLGTTGVSYYRTLQFNDFQVTGIVPEPATLGLLGLSCAALFLRRRRA